ncbi:UvrD-helicase domain-containing protein [Yersinia mollaretii]|uniref:DNA 3'-5' helicase II n=3 Tax=Yersinia mollaretii TaxID=33060 RepID=A0AA36LJB5_YERMO|nr:UvrD-helicase domain-containing protein [Yersinia mollaretii]CNH45171.1 DNA-dependent helicase II [Yersinia mollaretii]
MAAQMKKKSYSDETVKILNAVSEGKNFLLSGGAGSGKTYSLIESISGLLENNPLAKVACITYTNTATNEIENRIDNECLKVSTIHDFLWSSIKHFQKELKTVLIDLINDEEKNLFNVISATGEPEKILCIAGDIEYKEFVKLRDGIVSHDQIPVLAHVMFSKFPKLCRILNDSFKFILVDEYQDTSPLVVDILLNCLASVPRRNIVGFFGDSMQSIFEGGIGNLDAYKGNGRAQVHEIYKQQNRRNPTAIINLANKIRTDGLIQVPSDDISAPNMNKGVAKLGSAVFLYSSDESTQVARDYLRWDLSPLNTKELNLTHNLIAVKGGFPNLMRIYDADKILEYVRRLRSYIKSSEPEFNIFDKSLEQVCCELKIGKSGKLLDKVCPTPIQVAYIEAYHENFEAALKLSFESIASIYIDKDMLIDDQKADQSTLGGSGANRDHLIKHLYKIQKVIQLYEEGDFNSFLGATDLKINNHKDKVIIKSAIEGLSQSDGKTIGDVISEAHLNGLVRRDDRLEEFARVKAYVYNQVCKVSYDEFRYLYKYIDGKTPYSTQHKTKGREYDNVLVIMDNGKWNHYNFEEFFLGGGKDSVLSRTRKLVYVCCTRARDNLAMFYPQPSGKVIEKAKDLFGADNVIEL